MGQAELVFLVKQHFPQFVVPHSSVPSDIMLKIKIFVNGRFSPASSYPTIYVILWITELLFIKPALNNKLCKIKKRLEATHSSQDPAPCPKTLQGHGSMRKVAWPHFISIKINHSATWKPVGLSYFIDKAVKGKTGNKKCSLSKHCCLETLYF